MVLGHRQAASPQAASERGNSVTGQLQFTQATYFVFSFFGPKLKNVAFWFRIPSNAAKQIQARLTDDRQFVAALLEILDDLFNQHGLNANRVKKSRTFSWNGVDWMSSCQNGLHLDLRDAVPTKGWEPHVKYHTWLRAGK